MIGTILLRGLLIGVLAGLLAVGFARIFGEPSVERAIAFEKAAAQASGEPPEPEMVSRATQSGLGLVTGGVLYGAGMGGLFALAFAVANGRMGGLGPRATSGLLGAAGFLTVALVPFVKYPASPPSIGEAETIGMRTALFFAMILLSIVAFVVSSIAAGSLKGRLGAWNAGLVGALCFMALTGLAGLLLPAVDEVPETFPAAVLWDFRVASLGMLAVLWGTLGLGLGAWMASPAAPSRPTPLRPRPIG